MREIEGLEPDNRTAGYLIRACVQAKNMARAHQVASNMLKFHKLKVSSFPLSWSWSWSWSWLTQCTQTDRASRME
jgi:hypothetical protein